MTPPPGQTFPPSFRARPEQGEGVPLFIEELTRTAIETGLPAEHWEQEARKSVAGVPRSLRSSLVRAWTSWIGQGNRADSPPSSAANST